MSKKTTANILQKFKRYLKLECNFSQNTIDAYFYDVGKLVAYCDDKGLDLVSLELSDLEDFAATLHDIGIGAVSQCRVLCGVRSLFRFMALDGFREDDPSELLESPQMGEHLPDLPRRLTSLSRLSTFPSGKGSATRPSSRCCFAVVCVSASWCR